MTSWFRSLFGGLGQRVSGRPTSGNGASSMHLWWDVRASEGLAGAAVTLEVSIRPDIDDLVFMAMQVSFVDPVGGGAHLGLQHHPNFPDRSAVNWGGYSRSGGLLDGSVSELFSTPSDVNTRDFPWTESTPYRLDVRRGRQLPDGRWAWIGSVTDVDGAMVVVRELHSEGSTIRDPVVWMECFAPCDAPSFAVAWTDPAVTTAGGTEIPIRAMRTTYQRHAEGGCTNTSSALVGSSFTQRTNTPRTTPRDARLSLD